MSGLQYQRFAGGYDLEIEYFLEVGQYCSYLVDSGFFVRSVSSCDSLHHIERRATMQHFILIKAAKLGTRNNFE